MAEHPPCKRKAAGSSPARCASNKQKKGGTIMSDLMSEILVTAVFCGGILAAFTLCAWLGEPEQKEAEREKLE